MTLLLCGCFSVQAQPWKKTYSEQVDTFPSGQVKKITITKTKSYRDQEPKGDYYVKKTVLTSEFFDDGTKKLEQTLIHKNGNVGRICKEIRFKEKTYYKDGKRRRSEKRKCDRWHGYVKDYNTKGQLVKVVRTHYKKRKKA